MLAKMLRLAGWLSALWLFGCGSAGPFGPSTSPAAWAAIGDPNCSQNGCVRSARHAGNYTALEVYPYSDLGVYIDNGYSVGVLEFVTGSRVSSATITIPYPLFAPAGGYSIVGNAHGSVGLDDPCRLSGTVLGTGMAGLFGARTAIGITPDGPGLGTAGILPYLVREVEGDSMLDALRAARAVARALEVPLTERYAVVGLSEGGYTTLAAASRHAEYAPELNVRAFAAAAPADAWLEHWSEGIAVNGDHVPYHAMLFYAWQRYYDYAQPSLWTPQVADIIDGLMANACAYDFEGQRKTYLQTLGPNAEQIFAPDLLRGYRAGKLPESAAVLTRAFDTNRIRAFEQTAPLSIWQGTADVTVPVTQTDELVDALRAGGVEVDYHVVDGADHTTTAFGPVTKAQLATMASIAWVRDKLAH
jgi:pimeloyl-ACP methyl ester carboxylesterase